MNLHLLRIFVEVVESGSFSSAAHQLGISQPAVSKGVRQLETQLETQLLDRHGRSFSPSEPGQTLYHYGKQIFTLEQEAEEAISAYYGLDRGTLVIGASTTIAAYWLPPLLNEFKSLYPGIKLSVISGNTRQITKQLIDYQIDVAIIEGKTHDTRIELRYWFEEEMVVIGPNLLSGATHSNTVHDIESQCWVVREPGSGSREATDRLFVTLGLTQVKMIEVGSNEAIVQTVAAGAGIGLVPYICASDQLQLRKVVKIDVGEHSISRELYRVRLSNRTVSQPAIFFEALIARYGANFSEYPRISSLN